MPVGACGVSCDACGLLSKCGTCVPGTDPRAQKKLGAQMRAINMACPILACAVEKKVGYCTKDCAEFPCARFETGFEALQGKGPYPYSASYLNMFRRRLGRK